MRAMRLVILLSLLLLGGCVTPPNLAPLPPGEAQRLREGATPAGAVLVLLPTGEPAPGLPLAGEVPILLDDRPLAPLAAQDALVIPPAGSPFRLAAGAGSRRAEVTVQPGQPAYLGVEPLPPTRPEGPVGATFTPLDAATARGLLAGRRIVQASAEPPAAPQPASLRALPDASAAEAVAAGRIPPGFGRVVVAAGAVINERSGFASLLPNLTGARGDVVIEGVPVAFIVPPEALAIDLPPGTYAMHWRLRGPIDNQLFPTSFGAPQPVAVTVRAGETTRLLALLLDRAGVRVTIAPGGTPVGSSTGLRHALLEPVPPGATLAPGIGTQLVVPPPGALAALPMARLPGR
jgi:hypothetical protein